MNDLPNLEVKHHRIESPDSPIWDLSRFVYQGGAKLHFTNENFQRLQTFPIIQHRIKWMQAFKEYCLELLDGGSSQSTAARFIICFKPFIRFCDDDDTPLKTSTEIESAFYRYAEYQFTREQLKEIKTAYTSCYVIAKVLRSITESNQIDIKNTRLKPRKKSRRAISREADKETLSDSSKLGWFVYDICKNFDPKALDAKRLPIYVEVRKELVAEQKVNITLLTRSEKIEKSEFPYTSARHAFNLRVAAECLFFLAMTEKNAAETLKLERQEFDYKPLGENYQVRKYKNRKGGEVVFTIPKPYREMFERYLEFLSGYATECKWLFPVIDSNGAYCKRINNEWKSLASIVIRHGLRWIAPRSFRKTGLNLLLRISADEQQVADYGNHAVATFRENYELPSQQRAIVELTRFWDSNDPLTHGRPKISLFNTRCSGIAESDNDRPKNIVEPDCSTPSGCLWCRHFRDEESFDYTWNLFSYRYLKIIESSSYLDEGDKPSDLIVERLNTKIQWLKSADKPEYLEWVEEAEMRIEEGDYHPVWKRKIIKFEG